MNETLFFNLKIANYLPDILLQVQISQQKIRLAYDFGPSYGHVMEMKVNGEYGEIVLRKDKLLFEFTSTHNPSISYDDQYNIREGRILNARETFFIAGAGNGLFGMGITKPEWLKDCYFVILVTSNGYFFFDVYANHECILNFKSHSVAQHHYINESAFSMRIN